jgi:hypothetical protein
MTIVGTNPEAVIGGVDTPRRYACGCCDQPCWRCGRDRVVHNDLGRVSPVGVMARLSWRALE